MSGSAEIQKPPDMLSFPLAADEDGWPPFGSETLPVKVVRHGVFTVLTPPFFVKDLSADDTIEATIAADGSVTDWHHSRRSCNTTVWVLQGNAESLDDLAGYFLDLGCNIERLPEFGLLSVDVPPSIREIALDDAIGRCREIGAHIAVPAFRFDEPGHPSRGPQRS